MAEDLTFRAEADGTWATTLPIDRFKVGKHTNQLLVYAPELGTTSAVVEFVTRVQIAGDAIRVSDPADDDNGIYGTYGYPDGCHLQQSIGCTGRGDDPVRL
ncbi:MAG UNVERIFIED_CONTAM: hypothetical protein LVT10_09260 [Anaerolineae bacterium]